ncbi:DUF2975 domain-containing protein [Parasedimentitalea maritima]|uniref:DUF2975 domain-containing protein n=1 Tax=Parasedimentitalea maritima TaxID=2578117 RepID=A0ABY2V2E4_9RHOB|nr:DUF2975 domain-containing protein [Zongyanglinia marina]TLP68980.1 DUF2975 domain-containing protein [Zongyanglinia marina]
MKMSRLTNLLFVLIAVTAILSLTDTIFVFQSDFPLALQVDGEVWIRKISEFSISDRVAIFSMLEFTTLPWYWALFMMWRLAKLYRDGQYFTPQNSRCFVGIAYALIAMSILDTLIAPVIGGYFYYRGILDGMPDMDVTLILADTDLLTAGLFFFLIGMIMEKASTLREEADMTI